VRIPLEVQEKIVEMGTRVLSDDASEVDLGEECAVWLRERNPVFALIVLADWARKRIRSHVYAAARAAVGDDGDNDGQLVLPFPELHPWLEIAPGRKCHQSAMTGRDWDNALAIYRNRKEQAEVSYRELERRYHQIRHLLVDELTTADIMDRLVPVPVG
jgi:hypothetical protein